MPADIDCTQPSLLESTFKDQINPKRQTAGPPEGGSPELDLGTQPSVACNSDALLRRKNPITDCSSGIGPTHGVEP